MAKDTATAADTMRVVVVTPEATIVDEAADFVAVPLFDGELGVAPRHAPMIGRLGFGDMRIVQGSSERRLYVDGGFIQVVDNVVSILTNRAVDAKDLNPAVAEEQLKAAVAKRAPSDDEQAIRERAIAQARAQLRSARHAK